MKPPLGSFFFSRDLSFFAWAARGGGNGEDGADSCFFPKGRGGVYSFSKSFSVKLQCVFFWRVGKERKGKRKIKDEGLVWVCECVELEIGCKVGGKGGCMGIQKQSWKEIPFHSQH